MTKPLPPPLDSGDDDDTDELDVTSPRRGDDRRDSRQARLEDRLWAIEIRSERMNGRIRLIQQQQMHAEQSLDSWHRALEGGQQLLTVKIDTTNAAIANLMVTRDRLSGAWQFFNWFIAIGAASGIIAFIRMVLVR